MHIFCTILRYQVTSCVAFYCNCVEIHIVSGGENLFNVKSFRPKTHVKHFSFHEQLSEIS